MEQNMRIASYIYLSNDAPTDLTQLWAKPVGNDTYSLQIFNNGAWRPLVGSGGKNAYELAVEKGYTGSLEEWLLSLKGVQGNVGPQGPQGEQGEQGEQGDEGKGIESITYSDETSTATLYVITYTDGTTAALSIPKGEQGPAGQDGVDGTSAGFGTPVVNTETLSAGSSATVSVSASGSDTAKVFNFSFGIPTGPQGPVGATGNTGAAGEDAYQPFKGWFDSSSALESALDSPEIGDYAFVMGATSSDPAAVYHCATAGTWSDSGYEFNPANNQEFLSGESLNTVRIIDDLTTGGATNVLSAKQGKELKSDLDALGPKINQIAAVVGGIETEVQVDLTSGKSWVSGKTIFSVGNEAYEGKAGDAATSSFIAVDVSNYQGKTLHYARRKLTSAPTNYPIGMAFYTSDGWANADAVIIGAGEDAIYGASESGYVDSGIVIPTGAKTAALSFTTANINEFYAYVKAITTTEGLQKDVADLKDAVEPITETLFDKQYSASSDTAKKLFDVEIAANKTFTLNVSPSGAQNPTRVCVFANNNNNGNSRLFDSNLTTNPYNTDIQITRNFAISSIDVAFFPVDGNGVNVLVTIPKNGISISANDIPDGAISSQKLADNSVSAAKLADGAVSDSKIDANNVSFLAIQKSSNLFNKNDADIIVGKYINSAGTVAANSQYNVSGYIPVEAGKAYSFSPQVRTHEYYKADKSVISASFVNVASSGSTAPENAAYLRVSYYATNANSQKVNEGESKPYEEYFATYVAVNGEKIKANSVNGSSLKDESISLAKLNSDVKNAIKGGTLGRFVEQGVVAASEYLLLPKIHIQKNNLLACDIVGTIELVAVGVGYSASATYFYRDYAALWVEVDATNIKQYRAYNNEPQLISTNAHGLTLTSRTKIVLDLSVANGKAMIFTDDGGYYETSLQSAGVGKPFAYNGGTSSITCTLSDYPRELAKKVWLFGDSYISFVGNNRWPYYFAQNGHIDWFCNSQPGLSPESAYSDLQNLLTLGHRPKLLVWLLGMNGATTESQVDGQYVINSSQKQYIDAVVSICNEYDITLVLGVIPTVPTRQKTGFGIYVKSLGVRYIDFAAAVGTDSSGNWNEGLLSSDGVHPSITGAKVLASQVYVDCPELAIIE